MSKKDFVAIAAALRILTDKTKNRRGWDVLRETIARIADVCAASNDCFDRAKFLRACGM